MRQSPYFARMRAPWWTAGGYAIEQLDQAIARCHTADHPWRQRLRPHQRPPEPDADPRRAAAPPNRRRHLVGIPDQALGLPTTPGSLNPTTRQTAHQPSTPRFAP
jgi:hypothetical protein